jgi:hypothetical protein
VGRLQCGDCEDLLELFHLGLVEVLQAEVGADPSLVLVQRPGTLLANLMAGTSAVAEALANSRAQWSAPEHASIPILQGGSAATISFLARSTPRVKMAKDFPFRVS